MQLAITKNTIGSFIAKQLDKLLCYLYQNNIKKDTQTQWQPYLNVVAKKKNQNISHLLSLLLYHFTMITRISISKIIFWRAYNLINRYIHVPVYQALLALLSGSLQLQALFIFDHQNNQSLRDCLLRARKNTVLIANNAEVRYDTMNVRLKVYF